MRNSPLGVLLAALTVVGLVACDNGASVALSLGSRETGALSGISAATQLQAVLIVACDDGTNITLASAVGGNDEQVVFAGAPPCGSARVTLELWAQADQDAPVLAFRSSAMTVLRPGEFSTVEIAGALLGEIVLDPQSLTSGICVIATAAGEIQRVELAETPVPVSLPLASYAITCTSSAGLVVEDAVDLQAGTRSHVAIDFTPVVVVPAVSLATVTINDLPLAGFDPSALNLAYVSPYGLMTISIAVTTLDPNATVSIAAAAPATGSASFDGVLDSPSKSFTIVVTNGDATATYTLAVTMQERQLTSVTSIDAVAVEPSFDRSSAGPYVFYLSAATDTFDLVLDCTPVCADAALTIGSETYAANDGVISAPVGQAAASATLTVEDQAAGTLTYEITIVRGGLTGIIASTGALTPAFDPSVFTYTGAATGTTVSFTYADDSHVVVAPNTATLGECSTQIPVTVKTLQGTLIDTYTITIRTGGTSIYDYIGATDTIESGPLGYLAQGRNGVTFSEVAKGPPITESEQRPGTVAIYFLHYDNNTSASAISVRTVGGSDALTLRARVATPVNDADYMLDVGTMHPMSIAFHPTAPVLFTWSPEGYVYSVGLSGAFVDGATAGSPGLPQTPSRIGGQFNFGANGTVRVSPDGKWLYTIALGVTGANLRVLELNPTTGALVSELTPQTLVSVLTDAVVSHEGGMLVVGSAAGTAAYRTNDATGIVTSATVDTSRAGAVQLLAHPTQDKVYTLTTNYAESFSYVLATSSVTRTSSFGAYPFFTLAIDPTGAEYAYFQMLGSDYTILGYAFNTADYNLVGANGNNTVASTIDLSFAVCQ